MNNIIKFLIVSVFFSMYGCDTSTKSEVKAESYVTENANETLKLMTYNIRLDVASDGENAWSNRKDFLTSQVLFLSPDLMGVQEARPNQIEDLTKALTGYKYIGLGRDGDNKGEHSAIYYNASRLKVENENTFWLSKTPQEVSQGWDAAYPRICTYGLFTVKESQEKFWVFNTHLDHVGEMAKKEGMKLILNTITSLNTENYPVVVMGDFNVEPDSEVIGETKKTMSDSRELANLRFGNEGTFNGFKYYELANRRIDYILLSKASNVIVEKYAVLTNTVDFKFPSDHFPVFVELKLK